MMTKDQAAEICGVSLRTLHRWTSVEGLPTVRVGRTVRIQHVDLHAFVERHLVSGQV